MLCKVLGGLSLYSTLNQTFDLSVAAQASVGIYTVLISTVSVGYYSQKIISVWHAFVLTSGLLIASKVLEFNQTKEALTFNQILMVGGCFVFATILAQFHAKTLRNA